MNFRSFIFYGQFWYFRGTSKIHTEIRDYLKKEQIYYNKNCPLCYKYCPTFIITSAWILILQIGK